MNFYNLNIYFNIILGNCIVNTINTSLLKLLLLYTINIYIFNFIFIYFFCYPNLYFSSKLRAPAEVEVNYLPKKQWKVSKHDLSSYKYQIERNLRSKLLQMQLNWKNKESTENYMIQNSRFSQPQIVPPSAGFPYANGYSFNNMGYPNGGNGFLANTPSSLNIYPNGKQLYSGRDSIDINRLEKKIDKIVDKIKKEDMSPAIRSAMELNGVYERNLQDKPILYDNSKFTQVDNSINNNQVISDKYNTLINSNVDSIVNKYKSKTAVKQIKAFEQLYKNYNSTKSVNSKDIEKKVLEYTNTHINNSTLLNNSIYDYDHIENKIDNKNNNNYNNLEINKYSLKDNNFKISNEILNRFLEKEETNILDKDNKYDNSKEEITKENNSTANNSNTINSNNQRHIINYVEATQLKDHLNANVNNNNISLNNKPCIPMIEEEKRLKGLGYILLLMNKKTKSEIIDNINSLDYSNGSGLKDMEDELIE